MDSNYSFYIRGLELKDVEEKGTKQHYLKGYISTSDLDSVNDIVTTEALDDMVTQLKNQNIKLDLNHELVKKNVTIPLGRIVQSVKDTKGILVEVLLNDKYPNFKDIYGMLQKKFIDAFSITFDKPKIGEFIVRKGIRYLKKINLINIAATPYPANTGCDIVDVFTKSIGDIDVSEKSDKDILNDAIDSRFKKLTEESKMAENEPGKDEGKDIKDKALKDKIAQLETELKEAKEGNDQVKSLGDQLDEIKGKILNMEEFKGVKEQKLVDRQNAEIAELKEQLAEIFGILHAPQMRGVVSPEVGAAEAKELEGKANAGAKSTGGPLDYIR